MNSNHKKIQAVFLDRDGTIGEVGCDLNPVNFVPYPDFTQSLALLKAYGLKIFSFTNQPDISRGLIDEAAMVRQYHQWNFDRAYICPHTDEAQCNCRKPKPGMLLQAAEEFDLDLPSCVVIGDSWRDMLAADRVGCCKILVNTGLEENNYEMLKNTPIDFVAGSLFEGITWLIQHKPK